MIVDANDTSYNIIQRLDEQETKPCKRYKSIVLRCSTAECVVGDRTRGSPNEPPRQSTITVKDKIPLIIKASLMGDVTPDTAAVCTVCERAK